MSRPLEDEYIGLTVMEQSPSKLPSSCSSCSSVHSFKNEKETELRLGLPGSQSPGKDPSLSLSSVSLFGKELETSPLKSPFSGAKRGFSDSINPSSAKWGFSVSKKGFGTEEADHGNGKDALFSPRGGKLLNPLGSSEAVQKEVASVPLAKPVQEKKNQGSGENERRGALAAKAQVVGWPPIRSFRKNTMACNLAKKSDNAETHSRGCLYVKVCMDGAPYLRKVNLKAYKNYMELSSDLEKMFSCFTFGQCGSNGIPGPDGISQRSLKDLLRGAEYVLTYEDKDGDWMLVGDVPWEMFAESCRRLRIMKGSEATGLAPRALEKSKNRN